MGTSTQRGGGGGVHITICKLGEGGLKVITHTVDTLLIHITLANNHN